MKSPRAFAQLARNIQENGEPYIAADADEEHYHCHMIVARGVFRRKIKFEEKAAVTELLFCASENAPVILEQRKSPCAELYLGRVMRIAQPKVAIAVGAEVWRHLQKHFKEEIKIPIVKMEHPRELENMTLLKKRRTLESTIQEVCQHV